MFFPVCFISFQFLPFFLLVTGPDDPFMALDHSVVPYFSHLQGPLTRSPQVIKTFPSGVPLTESTYTGPLDPIHSLPLGRELLALPPRCRSLFNISRTFPSWSSVLWLSGHETFLLVSVSSRSWAQYSQALRDLSSAFVSKTV